MGTSESKTNVKPTGSFELFNISKDMVKKNLKLFAIIYAIPFLWTIVTTFNTNADPLNGDPTSISFNAADINTALVFGILAGTILAVIISVIYYTLTYCLQLQVAQGKTPTLTDIWDMTKPYWVRMLGLTILVGLIIIGGLLLFIVPGLIMIRRYYLAAYVLIDKDVSIREAMRQSAAMSKPYSGYIWSLIGVTVILSLPSVVPIVGGLISFLLATTYAVAPALRYEGLKKLSN